MRNLMTNVSVKKSRIPNFEILRTLAMLFIVAGHFVTNLKEVMLKCNFSFALDDANCFGGGIG